jgi:hypothetical protein
MFSLLALSLCLPVCAWAQTVNFDFDTGIPALTVGQGVPFDQTSGGVTAQFSSPQGNVFSVQTDASFGYTLSQFSGHYLYPSRINADPLTIQFSQQLTNITLTFATTDHPPIEIPNAIQLTAYANATVVGTPTTAGSSYGTDSFPMGTISFNSGGTPFNMVKITLVLPGTSPTGFLVDNIAVQSTGLAAPPTLQSAGSVSGPFTDDLTATVDSTQSTITVPVKPANQYYRLRSSASTRIEQIRVVSGQVILKYQ